MPDVIEFEALYAMQNTDDLSKETNMVLKNLCRIFHQAGQSTGREENNRLKEERTEVSLILGEATKRADLGLAGMAKFLDAACTRAEEGSTVRFNQAMHNGQRASEAEAEVKRYKTLVEGHREALEHIKKHQMIACSGEMVVYSATYKIADEAIKKADALSLHQEQTQGEANAD